MKVLYTVLLGLLCTFDIRADFQAGLRAYRSGNFTAAYKQWKPIAERGDANAQYNLALLYERGQGVRRDLTQAALWYRKSAEQGAAAAQCTLGNMYDLGEGVPKDYDEAMTWYRKAAGQGHAPAEVNLAILYYNAQGTKRDLVTAYAWLSRAAAAHEPRAAWLLRTTASRMSSRQIKKAQHLAGKWKPQPVMIAQTVPTKAFPEPGKRLSSTLSHK